MKKAVIIVLLIVLAAFALSGCNNKEIRADEIKFIEIRDGSFKTTYAVDEKIDFNNVYIVIALKDNKGEVVERVTAEMLEGFDTSTTTQPMEMRTMRVKYKGLYTSNWNYTVASPYVINTKARLILSSERTEDKLRLHLSIDLDKIPEMYALQMEVNYDDSRLANNITTEELPGWETIIVTTKTAAQDMLYHLKPGTEPITASGNLMVLVFDVLAEGDFNIQIKNIHISFGEEDIYLPDAVLK